MNPTAQFFEASDFETAWSDCLQSWFLKINKSTVSSRVAILVPQTSWAHALKFSCVNEGMSLWNVKWYTPGAVRARLMTAQGRDASIALREDLRFLLSLAASDLPNNLMAQSMLKEPELFLRHYDQLLSGGGGDHDFPTAASKELGERLTYYIECSGLEPVQKIDQALTDAIPPEMLWDQLLIYGFSHKNWGAFNILNAAVAYAKEVIVCHTSIQAGFASEVWLGSWEERLGPSQVCFSGELSSKPMTRIAEAMEFKNELDDYTIGDAFLQLHLTDYFNQEVDAIIAQLCEYLSQGQVSRLGVIFPSQSSALAREVGRRLLAMNIPHCDSIGFTGGETRAQSLLTAWLQWQEDPCLDHYLYFTKQLSHSGMLSEAAYLEIQEVFMSAFRDLMHDDFSLLLSLVARYPLSAEVKVYLRDWFLLSPRSSFNEYYQAVGGVLKVLGDTDMVEHLNRRSATLAKYLKLSMGRAHFLQWLREVAKPGGRVRSSLGREPFSKVHLVTTDNVLGQPWSHLIVTSMTKHDWESDRTESTLISDEYLTRLNKSRLTMGNQGEGHTTLISPYVYIPTQSDYKQLAYSIFKQMIGLPTHGIAFTASLSSSSSGERELLLSDWLIHVYWLSTGVFLNKKTQLRLVEETSAWLRKTSVAQQKVVSWGINQTKKAYEARRDPRAPFGEYEFGFREKPAEAFKLSSKTWEEAVVRPSAVWLKDILKVKKSICSKEAFEQALALGTWVHDWLALGEGVRPKIITNDWHAQVLEKSRLIRQAVELAYKSQKRRLPLWWEVVWAQACRKAQALVEAVNIEHKQYSYMLSEFKLPDQLSVELGGENVPLSGRIDLVWLSYEGGFVKNNAWVVDYKTGSQKPLTLKKLQQGEGLQLALYALALKQLGCEEVQFSIVNPASNLTEQLNLDDLQEVEPLLKKISSIYESGRLGQSGPLYDEYSFIGDYPLATLRVPVEVLDEKARLSSINE